MVSYIAVLSMLAAATAVAIPQELAQNDCYVSWLWGSDCDRICAGDVQRCPMLQITPNASSEWKRGKSSTDADGAEPGHDLIKRSKASTGAGGAEPGHDLIKRTKPSTGAEPGHDLIKRTKPSTGAEPGHDLIKKDTGKFCTKSPYSICNPKKETDCVEIKVTCGDSLKDIVLKMNAELPWSS